eukprot:scaffold32826_cov53-Attheya_sp.AAC.2
MVVAASIVVGEGKSAIPGFGDRGGSSCAPHARNFKLTLLSLIWYGKLGRSNGWKLDIAWVQGMTYSTH